MSLAVRDRRSLAASVAELGPWFHNIALHGVQTAPGHFLGDYPASKWARFQHLLPQDLAGRSVLDIGCNAGFYSVEMKRRGAGRVVAIDSDSRYLRQARFVFGELGLDIELEQMSVYEVGRLGRRFDLVLFLGVFYHLRHPLLALDLIHEHAAGDLLLFQSLSRGSHAAAKLDQDYPFSEESVFDMPQFPRLHFVEHRYAGDPTNWFIPNRAAMEGILRSAGFRIEAGPADDVYLCRRGARPPFTEAPPRIAASMRP